MSNGSVGSNRRDARNYVLNEWDLQILISISGEDLISEGINDEVKFELSHEDTLYLN